VTPFGAIMKTCVQATPNAIGGAFAASDGEMVDSFATIDAHEWAVLTAHYGVILSLLKSVFGVWHYGGVEMFIAQHNKLEIFVCVVDAGYYALVAIRTPADFDVAIPHLRVAAAALRREMM
jgi:hypothetical protein